MRVCGSTRPVRVLAVAALLLLWSVPAKAQNADLKDLWRYVTTGQAVRVKEANGRETRGVFEQVSDAGVSVIVNGKTLEIPAAELREIRRRGDSPIGGLWVGAAIGAGAATAVFFKCQDEWFGPCTDWKRGAGLGAAAGAGLGVVVDAAIRGWTVTYRDNGTSFVMRPAIQPIANGLLASLVFTTTK